MNKNKKNLKNKLKNCKFNYKKMKKILVKNYKKLFHNWKQNIK